MGSPNCYFEKKSKNRYNNFTIANGTTILEQQHSSCLLFVDYCLFVCLFACLLACLFVCLFVCLFACLFLFVCLAVCFVVCSFVCLF